MNNFLVDVFVLTYNRAEYLALMLDSILKQSYKNFNLYILDNASTDNTKEVVEFFLKKRDIQYIRHDKNIGYTTNMNFGFELSNLKYFIILHDDDILHNNYLYEMVNLMESKPYIALASCGMEGIDKNGTTIIKDIYGLESDIVYKKDQFIKDYCLGNNFIGCPTVIYRKSYFIENNIRFQNDVGPGTDTFLWLMVNNFGGIIYIYKKILYKYRYHKTQGSQVDYLELFYGLYKKMKGLFSNEYNKEIELFRARSSLLIKKNLFNKFLKKEINFKQFFFSKQNFNKSGLSMCFVVEIIIYGFTEILKKTNKKKLIKQYKKYWE